MMKVLQVGKFFPLRGGVEKVMYSLTTGLSERGIDCDMLCAKLRNVPFDPEDQPHARREEGYDLLELGPHARVICAPARRKVAGTMIAPAMVRWLRRHAAEYTIIHIHHPDPMAALALRLSGYRGKVILHWHSDILKQKFFLFFYRPLQRWLIRRSERIVGTTPVYVEHSPWLQKVRDKLDYIPIGCEPIVPDASRVAALRARYPGQKLILSIGRLVPYKGFSYLIDAAAALDAQYRILIGGEGPLHESLAAQIAQQGLEERVSLLGYIPCEDLSDLFGACDVFVLSSMMKTEAFGIVQIEAMSCGKPVITTDVPDSGMSWVNADGVSGRVVPNRDAAAIAAAIRGICGDPDAYRRYVEGARARYRAVFTTQQMIDKTIQLYENL